MVGEDNALQNMGGEMVIYSQGVTKGREVEGGPKKERASTSQCGLEIIGLEMVAMNNNCGSGAKKHSLMDMDVVVIQVGQGGKETMGLGDGGLVKEQKQQVGLGKTSKSGLVGIAKKSPKMQKKWKSTRKKPSSIINKTTVTNKEGEEEGQRGRNGGDKKKKKSSLSEEKLRENEINEQAGVS